MEHKHLFKVLILLVIITFVLVNHWFLKPASEDNHKEKGNVPDLVLRETSDGSDKQSLMITSQEPKLSSDFTRNTSNPQTTIPNITVVPWENAEKGMQIYGTISAGGNYSVFSSTTHNQASLNYLFALPLTALAWKRAGFKSIVILVVTSMGVAKMPRIQLLLSKLLELNCVVLLLESHPDSAVMVSQVSRLFVHHFIDSHCIDDLAKWDQTYLVTSDADLWPLKTTSHRLPPGIDIVSFNAFCCGSFVHKGQAHMMLPIGNIGMRVGTWLSVTRRHGFVPADTDSLITYFFREFGTVAKSSVQKGDNSGWFMDQRMISILIQDWASRNGNSQRVRYISRDVNTDRIDREAWKPFTIEGKMDAHILDSGYEPRTWHRLEALLVLMYDKVQFSWCQNYAKKFLAIS